jgi:hypothetical protein
MTKIAGSGSGFISQRHGSADPDPHQNVMDPQRCLKDMDITLMGDIINILKHARVVANRNTSEMVLSDKVSYKVLSVVWEATSKFVTFHMQ